MAQSANNTNTNATANNEVVNPSNAAIKQAQSRRLWENRDMWAVVFAHTVALIALTLKGEKLPENPRQGFAFGGTVTTKSGKSQKLKVSEDQPHIVAYAAQLLAGFGSYATKKATKTLNKIGLQNEVLADSTKRMAIASQLAEACKLAKQNDGASRLRREIDAHNAKQGRALVAAVAASINSVDWEVVKEKLNEVEETATPTEATPKGVEEQPKKPSKKSATPKGGKGKAKKAKQTV